ncbi:MAG: hypothetical protein ACKOXF_04370, partial [Chitinophagaceae bacterium]
MTVSLPRLILSIFLSVGFTVCADSSNSKINQWLTKHHFTVNAGYFRATYKKQDLLVVHPGYNRSIRFFDVEAGDISYFENIQKLQITATQHRVQFSADFNKNWQASLSFSHLNYGALTNRLYRAQGTWNGKHINDTVLMSDYVKGLYHTNGLNLWNFGLKKSIPLFVHKNHFSANILLGGHIGTALTSSEIEIRDTVGNKYLYFTPGNRLAGYNAGVNSALNLIIYEHYLLQGFWDWSYTNLIKAPFYEGYVKQKIFA